MGKLTFQKASRAPLRSCVDCRRASAGLCGAHYRNAEGGVCRTAPGDSLISSRDTWYRLTTEFGCYSVRHPGGGRSEIEVD